MFIQLKIFLQILSSHAATPHKPAFSYHGHVGLTDEYGIMGAIVIEDTIESPEYALVR